MRRQLAGGHLARQEVGVAETDRTTVPPAEVVRIPGLLQTADYARHVFTANTGFRQIPTAGTEDSVRAQLRREAALYEPGRSFRILIWEGTLYALTCPREVMAAQLDRFVSVIGFDAVGSASSPSPPSCVAARSRILDLRPAPVHRRDAVHGDVAGRRGHGRLSPPNGRRTRTGMAGQMLSWVTSCREGTDG
ncbi:Scr1 family TA system antitoxin-like transcriptional regulator [Streptomyces sp. NBC_00687]|uniref:Scr1 family TA system antitoxin-like transcriptional regulator n=1 Tax=Streptomyces sp. NBC_00687 TaxID=2975807 RepID=UPI00224FB1F5|nr:Scr1 family TA system antitoxin-like transcriptional regulator [Streptomyces sp. NBC_00687]MCX4919007.1 DUF5753 domain-containing protein [Streptomyces sp. NBC_00687]